MEHLLNQLASESLQIPLSKELLDKVDQALTHVSAGQHKNFERLEFLGDAVLRLAATEFIDHHYPNLPVGSCSNLRAQLVSDRWLAQLGEQLQLESLLVLGAKALGDAAARATLHADATEALIGAIYNGSGNNLEPIHRWLTPHWQRTTADVLAAPHRFNGKTILQEWSQAEGLGLPDYTTTEQSSRHGDPERFKSHVQVGTRLSADGFGRSRKEAEQNAAAEAIEALRK
ncbi:ribonuclease III [Synechococcus sp. AH-551-E05]|nr:ribonuclease III [Synechococcus sp. AH-551-E05]MDB4651074.1 ribonuclease III [Synechococcus sp. AH-551-E05]